ncbi:Spy/CpxP family protein refolding chaperone [Acidithiobacillus sp.]|uniref:Spy/CpxP family protein refolding chaperone n=1 Tax=Acidithiobacillus sp. TaxID=1872118 RepID=UPI0025BE1A38|nr:Spy/CpxP family protein refolding chaperone [Acidithiobacillus sp.]
MKIFQPAVRILATGLLLSAPVAFAADTGMMGGNNVMPAAPMGAGPMAGHGPMQGMGPHMGPMAKMANAPVPMLLPIVWRHAVELKLTPAQDKELQNWRKEAEEKMRGRWPEWRAHNLALRKALLDNAPAATLKPLEDQVLKDHAEMLQEGIAQVEFVHKLLTPEQWQRVTQIYADMEKRQKDMGHPGWKRP